jgi:nucleoside-diphosphate-sugar epimerase
MEISRSSITSSKQTSERLKFLLPFGTVVNIATGTQISLNELVNLLNEIFGSQKGPVYEPERLGDIKHSRANTRLSRIF